MDDLVRQQITLVESKTKASVPWGPDKPIAQPYHSWANRKWQPIEAAPSLVSSTASGRTPQTLALYAWNVDFMLPFPGSRMRAALHHLQSQHIAKQDHSIATVVFLQECVVSDLKLIASTPWVRAGFYITDLDGSNWASGHYGTTTLIDRRLPIDECFRVHYAKTRMQRDALFVDVELSSRGLNGQKQDGQKQADQKQDGQKQDGQKQDDSTVNVTKVIRLCNVHLESLANSPPFRPAQMELCASYMHAPNVDAAIIAGDMNAIQDFDKHLHTDNNLQDAYLALGGRETTEDAESSGHTWGQQAATVQRERFGTCRMDKIFFCGKVSCSNFKRFGADVLIEDAQEAEMVVELGFDKAWVTDHLGIKAVFDIIA